MRGLSETEWEWMPLDPRYVCIHHKPARFFRPNPTISASAFVEHHARCELRPPARPKSRRRG